MTTALINSLPPSFSDMTSGAASSGGAADSGFSFDDLLNVFKAPANDTDSDFTFHDLISVINPLQHFPIVSTVYRSLTGDSIKPLERIAGDTLYGGVLGFVSSVANVAFEKITGRDFGDTALALVEGKDISSPTALASNAVPATTAPTATTPTTPSVTAPPAAAAVAVASIAPALQPIATAPPAVPQRQATADKPATAANSTLSQRASAAYLKTQALPPGVSVDSIPIY